MKKNAFVNEVARNSYAVSFLSPDNDLRPLITTVKDKKIVMLGGAGHGTKEFYEWRSVISKDLILNHGFNFISVEGDWPSCQKVNQFIQNKNDKNKDVLENKILSHFTRWPTWMWANDEISELVGWLKNNNNEKDKTAGFYGLDVYSLYDSIDEVINLLQSVDSELATKIKSYYSCFDFYSKNEKAYARSLLKRPIGCKREVHLALSETLQYSKEHGYEKNEVFFNAIMNAQVVCSSERYYRAMMLGEEESWNVRDHHMMETLNQLLNHYGKDSKGIVWAHNNHVGDYRATDMIKNKKINLGGLARETLGSENVALIGFSTYSGTITASSSWDGPIQVLEVPKAIDESVEAEFHNAIPKIGSSDYYVLLNDVSDFSPLNEIRGQRSLGVVYQPASEYRGNYIPTILSKCYDAFFFIDQTKALSHHDVKVDVKKIPETYPHGTHV